MVFSRFRGEGWFCGICGEPARLSDGPRPDGDELFVADDNGAENPASVIKVLAVAVFLVVFFAIAWVVIP